MVLIISNDKVGSCTLGAVALGVVCKGDSMYDFFFSSFDAGRCFMELFFSFFALIILSHLYPNFHGFVRI